MPVTLAVSHNAVSVDTSRQPICDFGADSTFGEAPSAYTMYCTGQACDIWVNGTIGPIRLIADAAPYVFYGLRAPIRTIEAQGVSGTSTLTCTPSAS